MQRLAASPSLFVYYTTTFTVNIDFFFVVGNIMRLMDLGIKVCEEDEQGHG